MKLFLVCIFLMVTSVVPQQWVDPHDMNTDSKTNLKKSSSTGDLKNVNKSGYKDDKQGVEESNSLVYIKRFVNLLVNSATIDKSDPMAYHGKLSFSLENKDFEFLKEFSNSEKIGLDQLRKLDTILSDVFRKRYLDDIFDMFIVSQEKIVNVILSKNSLPLVGLCVFIYVAYNLFRSNFSVWYVFRYFVFIIVLVDYVQRYQQLFEEAEEHNMHLKYSTKCDTSKMSWGQYFKFLAGHEDCEKKIVSLLEVGLFQVRSVIIIPLSAFGTGMGQFASELWSNLPFPWNILIFPVMLIFCLFLVTIIMTIKNNTSFKINLMHLLHIEFGEKKNDIRSKTLNKLLDALGRPMVEDIKEGRTERTPQKGKNVSKETKKKNPLEIKDNIQLDTTSESSSKSPREQIKIDSIVDSPGTVVEPQ